MFMLKNAYILINSTLIYFNTSKSKVEAGRERGHKQVQERKKGLLYKELGRVDRELEPICKERVCKGWHGVPSCA
jgi:thiamine monophosphate synthase